MGAAIQQRWTDEKVELLKTLFAQGDLSAERMSEALGVSRNAVLGKLDRLGLKRKDYVRGSHTLVPGKPPPKKRLVHYRRAAPKPRSFGHHAPPWKDAIVKDNVRDLPSDESPFAVSLFDVKENQCRWPLGEPSAMTFCGDEKVHGHSYCARHCRLVYMHRPRPDERPSFGSGMIDPRSLDSVA